MSHILSKTRSLTFLVATFFNIERSIVSFKDKNIMEGERHRIAFAWLGYNSTEQQAFLKLDKATRHRLITEIQQVAKETDPAMFRDLHFKLGYRRDRIIRLLTHYSEFAHQHLLKITRETAIAQRAASI